MTVQELMAELAKYPPTMTVVLSKDSAGNNFSQLAHVTGEAWEAESTYSVIVYNEEDDDIEDLPKGPVLWPTN